VNAGLTQDTVPRRSPVVRIRKFRGALLVGGSEHMLELNGSAEFVFRRIDGVHSIGDIARLVQDTYGIPWHSALQDVEELIHELVDCQIAAVDK
jgi:Coenzyme PQQ synthesis protein D (PqqD)